MMLGPWLFSPHLSVDSGSRFPYFFVIPRLTRNQFPGHCSVRSSFFSESASEECRGDQMAARSSLDSVSRPFYSRRWVKIVGGLALALLLLLAAAPMFID